MPKNMTPQRIELSENNFHAIQIRAGNGTSACNKRQLRSLGWHLPSDEAQKKFDLPMQTLASRRHPLRRNEVILANKKKCALKSKVCLKVCKVCQNTCGGKQTSKQTNKQTSQSKPNHQQLCEQLRRNCCARRLWRLNHEYPYKSLLETFQPQNRTK